VNTASYIAGRLRIAGGDAARIFTQKAVIAIYEASGGLPRTVNVIADNALIGGFARQIKPVTAGIVREVCSDFDIPEAGAQKMIPEEQGDAPTPPEHAALAIVGRAETASNSNGDAAAQASAPRFNAFSRKRRFVFF
jgi:hypothetical protein